MAEAFEKLIGSPIGPLTLQGSECSLTGLRFGDARTGRPSCLLLEQASEELAEYFAGTRRAFTLPLSPAGTEFQQAVWRALEAIPYGQTVSYRDIALRIGNPKACRAVGMANNRNPIPILVPCHRVVGADGSLTGYAGGLDTKAFLLKLEDSLR